MKKRGIIPLVILVIVLLVGYILFGTDDASGATIPTLPTTSHQA